METGELLNMSDVPLAPGVIVGQVPEILGMYWADGALPPVLDPELTLESCEPELTLASLMSPELEPEDPELPLVSEPLFDPELPLVSEPLLEPEDPELPLVSEPLLEPESPPEPPRSPPELDPPQLVMSMTPVTPTASIQRMASSIDAGITPRRRCVSFKALPLPLLNPTSVESNDSRNAS
jgi:hypothetical protein